MYFVYYIGGPADLTKKTLNELPKGDMEKVAEIVPISMHPWRGNEEEVDYRTHNYYLRRISYRVFIAIHEPLFRDV